MGPVRIGNTLYSPIGIIPNDGLTNVSPSTRDILRFVLNSGFDQARMSVAMSTLPLALSNPTAAATMLPLLQMGLSTGQALTNTALTNYNQYAQYRQVPYYNGQPIMTAPLDQRYGDPYGFGGQYGYNQIQQQMPYVYPGQTTYPQMTYPQQLPPGGVGTPMPYSQPISAAPVYGSNAATGTSATVGAGFAPTGDTTYDLANAIANAPTYSPTEQALLSKIKDPEQRAIQELQMQMQKQALLCTVLTNLANMRHEMLKAVAQNLRS